MSSDLWNVLVIALIFSEPDTPNNEYVNDQATAALQRFVYVLQIDNPANGWHRYPLGSGVNWIRYTMPRVDGAPKLETVSRLPSATTINESLSFAAKYRMLCPYCQEAENREWIWYSMKEASDSSYPWSSRRLALGYLRNWLGADVFERGEWPAPVPLHLIPVSDR